MPRWAQFDEPGQLPWSVFPAIVKPAWEHCSIGVDRWAVVLDADELERRVAHVIAEYDQPALVEDFIDGREFHVPLWGNDTVEMLPPVEMDFSALGDVRDRLCSYEAKFDTDSAACRRIASRIPARLTAARSATPSMRRAAWRTVSWDVATMAASTFASATA